MTMMERPALTGIVEARELTDQIKVAVEATWQLVARAYTTRAWALLGYSSWDDYCTREFGTSRLRLPREERQDVVASLRESGLSVRAIAAVTGDSKDTVSRALSAGVSNETPASDGAAATSEADEWQFDDDDHDSNGALVDEIIDGPEPKVITGIDGKRYSATPPAVRRRPALTDELHAFAPQFRRAVERLERFGGDDRFGANKEQVAVLLNGHLTYAVEVCQDLLDRLSHNTKETS